MLVFVELDSSLAYYVDTIIKGYILAVGTYIYINHDAWADQRSRR